MLKICNFLSKLRLKPCKIQGIELIDRPLTTLGRRKSEKIGKNV